MNRIILVRHGRSAHARSGWLDRAAVDAWQSAWELTRQPSPGSYPSIL
jgi:broad specificity phosphatase PhoE